ncbi:MAG: GDP-mannose 4,6-dehydratase [Bacteroidetes bacterium]|nr:GDP-mannose 4,6-dehydratase [Bacteroidota bacterium]
MTGAHILVTGGAGFIGSHVSERLLAAGARVTVVDNFDPFYPRLLKEENLQRLQGYPLFRFLELDIRDAGMPAQLDALPQVDAVIHLAAKAGVLPSIEDPDVYTEVNIRGTQHLLEWMRRAGVNKLVFGSSSSVYGNSPRVPFREEETPDRPISPYAFTKRACELMTHTWHHLFGLDVLNLRFFTVFGPGQRPDLAIRKFTDRILRGEPIPVYGDGSTARDYTYVGDIADGVVRALQHVLHHQGVYDILNLGNHSPITLSEMIATLEQVIGLPAIIDRQPLQPGDVTRTWADISRAQQLIGYYPATSFTDGVARFVTWYREKQFSKAH